MSFSATILLDSLSPSKHRLITYALRYPRFIHSELMTHRMLNRNASSSRAIPVKKQLARIMEDPAMPIEWGKNQPGMQATQLLTDEKIAEAKALWLTACQAAVSFSDEMEKLNVHKQITNRIAEPWSHILVVVTATEWANFFGLRDHPDAQPEFRHLAKLMVEAYRASEPKQLAPHEWHLPFITDEERKEHTVADLKKFSVARCARTSYFNHDGSNPDLAKDAALHDDLVVRDPLHASPAEHQGTPFFRSSDGVFGSPFHYPYDLKWNHRQGRLDTETPWSASFRGWYQYRQSLPRQNIEVLPWENSLPSSDKDFTHA